MSVLGSSAPVVMNRYYAPRLTGRAKTKFFVSSVLATSPESLTFLSVLLGHEVSALQGGLVVVLALVFALEQFHFFPLHLLVGNEAQEVRNTVEARPLFVIRTQDVPGRNLRIGGLQHHVARGRIVVPAAARWEVRRTQLPLAQLIGDTRFKTALLFRVAYFQPILDELDALVDNDFLDVRAKFEEVAVLCFGAEPHDILHAGAVVPTAVKNDDLPGRWKMLHITLDVQLRLLAVRRSRQSHDAKYPRAHALCDRFDGSPLAGAIAPFQTSDEHTH